MKTIKYDIDSWFDDGDDGISIPEFTTKKKLKNFCKEYTIDKDIFEEMEEMMPPGTDLLTELGKYCDLSKQDYVKTLLRTKKLDSI